MEYGPWAARLYAAFLYARDLAYLHPACDWTAQFLTARAPLLSDGAFGTLREPTAAVPLHLRRRRLLSIQKWKCALMQGLQGRLRICPIFAAAQRPIDAPRCSGLRLTTKRPLLIPVRRMPLPHLVADKAHTSPTGGKAQIRQNRQLTCRNPPDWRIVRPHLMIG